MNNKDNMPLLKHSNTTIVGPEECNIADAQDKEFKIAILNMFKDPFITCPLISPVLSSGFRDMNNPLRRP